MHPPFRRAPRLAMVLISVTLGACDQHATEPEVSAPVVPSLSVSTGELLTRTLNGCSYSYSGSRTRQVPDSRSQVRLVVQSRTAGCRLVLEPLQAPLSFWMSRSGATTVSGGSGELVLTIAQNSAPWERSGLVTIMAETPRGRVVFTTVNVIQAPAPPPPPTVCRYTPSSMVNELAQAGESRQVIITADNALCNAPVIRNAATWQSPSFPGGMTAVISPVSTGRWALTLTAPLNATSLVRSGQIQLGRANGEFVGDIGLVIVAQRGIPSATAPRLPSSIRLTGASQQTALDLSSPNGECWLWNVVTHDGVRSTGFVPSSGYNPTTGCGSSRIGISTTTNTTGAPRSTIVWLKSADMVVTYDFSIITQSSF